MTRRFVLQILAGMMNAAIVVASAFPALSFLAYPLTRKRKPSEFVRVAPLSALNSSAPTRVAVVAERTDSFLRFPASPVGQVWLDAGTGVDRSSAQVRCLQTICPHLGCSIDYSPDRGGYACPCHTSDFSRDGRRLNGPSPRDMDELECRVSDPDGDGQRWVEIRYQQFRTGTAERRPLA